MGVVKKPFAVGDRVAVYSTERDTGVVVKLLSDTQCMVTVAAAKNVHIAFEAAFHVKQLRRLVPRKPAREWWVIPHETERQLFPRFKGVSISPKENIPGEDWIHVREVRPKK